MILVVTDILDVEVMSVAWREIVGRDGWYDEKGSQTGDIAS